MIDPVQIQRGLCHCGCGGTTSVPLKSNRRRGVEKGVPMRFIHGHHNKLQHPGYAERDCGFSTPCWIWLGYINESGYAGVAKSGGNSDLAHRFYYERHRGPIPEGLTLDHLCRQRACVNPAHLEPVTIGVNVLRGEGPSAINARRVTCSNGHPLEGQNLVIRKNGNRKCRTCDRIAARNHKRRKSQIPPDRWRVAA